MKKEQMKKRVCGILLAALTLAGVNISEARAEVYEGAEGWEVSFTGNGMESSFKSSELSDGASALQPGDEITFRVALKNEYSGDTDWYMANEVLSSLEDSQKVAQGGAYTYILAYRNGAGEDITLYSSENVGGEGKGGLSEQGLHEATDSLEDFFYLDTLEAGGESLITLKVCLDGETQGNAYQDTMAKLQMNFAVEKAARGENTGNGDDPQGSTGDTPGAAGDPTGDTGATPLGSGGRNGKAGGDVYMSNSARTGDETNLFFWCLAALCSGLGLLACAAVRQKRGGRKVED